MTANPDGPRNEQDRCHRCAEGYHDSKTRICSYCGSTDRYPARRLRRRGPIRRKRGRNSGKTSNAKNK